MSDLDDRALARMREVVAAYANGQTLWGRTETWCRASGRANAIVQLFATLDALLTGRPLPPNRVEHTISMLMLLREYVVPLPTPSTGEKLLREDIERLLEAVHEARRSYGLPD